MNMDWLYYISLLNTVMIKLFNCLFKTELMLMQKLNLIEQHWTLFLTTVSHVDGKRILKNRTIFQKISFAENYYIAEMLLTQYDATMNFNESIPDTLIWIAEKSKVHFNLTYTFTHRLIKLNENSNEILYLIKNRQPKYHWKIDKLWYRLWNFEHKRRIW